MSIHDKDQSSAEPQPRIATNVYYLQDHPRYVPDNVLFSPHRAKTPLLYEQLEQWHAENAKIEADYQRALQESATRKQRIRASLALASSLDVLYGDVPIMGQYFGDVEA